MAPSAQALMALPNLGEVRDYAEALERSSDVYRAMLARHRSPLVALRHYGLVHWERADFSQSVAAFRAAVALDVENPVLWRELAAVYDGSQNQAAAKVCAEEALRLQPAHAQSWSFLAGIELRCGEHENAEAAYQNALRLDPTLGESHFGLALLQFKTRRLNLAAESLMSAISSGYDNFAAHATLGHVRYLTGDFSGCIVSFGFAEKHGELDAAARQKLARCRLLETCAKTGDVALAIESYELAAGDHAEGVEEALKDAFALASAYNLEDVARRLAHYRMSKNPSDIEQRYLLDVLEGRPLTRAPVEYLETHFDAFATRFEEKLVNILQYEAPGRMARMLAAQEAEFQVGLDIGCGTGLAAPLLKPICRRLIGVDLSANMLEEAAKLSLYDELAKAEVLEFLRNGRESFDLIFAADLLCYFGDLEPLFVGVAQALQKGGIFVASIEAASGEGFSILRSGRFAHDPLYIEKLARGRFDILRVEPGQIRLEAARPVDGFYFLMKRVDPN